jgi:DNA recombination protein RmuC
MTEFIFLLIGLLFGAVTGWLFARMKATRQIMEIQGRTQAAESTNFELRQQIEKKDSELTKFSSELETERTARVTAETRLEEAKKSINEQKKILDEATQRLKDTFNALSADALKSNNQLFLELARKTLENLLTEAKGDLGKRQEAINGTIKPLKEALGQFQTRIRDIENAREQAYGGLRRHLEDLTRTHEHLQKETANLVTALKAPQVRGRWGEITLRRVVEVAGMSKYCDFEEQPSVETEEGRRRPDLIVKLPGSRTVVVDAKVPLKAYMDATESQDENNKQQALLRHAQAVKTHMQLLGSKAYWNQFSPSPDFVVLFLPGESFFSAALEQDRGLIEDGISRRVILATPTTLIALLRTVAYSWQQQQVAENAQRIWQAGTELFDRVYKFSEHLSKVRDGLNKATESYNAAIGSWISRVVPSARKLKELEAAPQEKEIVEIGPIETPLRRIVG